MCTHADTHTHIHTHTERYMEHIVYTHEYTCRCISQAFRVNDSSSNPSVYPGVE